MIFGARAPLNAAVRPPGVEHIVKQLGFSIVALLLLLTCGRSFAENLNVFRVNVTCDSSRNFFHVTASITSALPARTPYQPKKRVPEKLDLPKFSTFTNYDGEHNLDRDIVGRCSLSNRVIEMNLVFISPQARGMCMGAATAMIFIEENSKPVLSSRAFMNACLEPRRTDTVESFAKGRWRLCADVLSNDETARRCVEGSELSDDSFRG